MRVSALDQLNSMFDGHVWRRSEQQVDMLRHHHKGMQLESAFVAIAIDGLQKQPYVVLDDEQSTTLPCRECYEVSPGRRDESSRLQKQTSAVGSRVVCLD